MKNVCILLFCIISLTAISQNSDAIKNPDIMPQFPGGEEEMMKYIQANLKVPDQIKNDETTEGCKNIIEFTIEYTGYIKDVSVVRSCVGCNECDTEAIKLIEKMPKWKPGLKDGKIVAVKMALPIFFTHK